MRWDPKNPVAAGTLLGWAMCGADFVVEDGQTVMVPTPAGPMKAGIGDWIICGADFFTACTEEEFPSFFQLD
jgi:hypothetical protein